MKFGNLFSLFIRKKPATSKDYLYVAELTDQEKNSPVSVAGNWPLIISKSQLEERLIVKGKTSVTRDLIREILPGSGQAVFKKPTYHRCCYIEKNGSYKLVRITRK